VKRKGVPDGLSMSNDIGAESSLLLSTPLLGLFLGDKDGTQFDLLSARCVARASSSICSRSVLEKVVDPKGFAGHNFIFAGDTIRRTWSLLIIVFNTWAFSSSECPARISVINSCWLTAGESTTRQSRHACAYQHWHLLRVLHSAARSLHAVHREHYYIGSRDMESVNVTDTDSLTNPLGRAHPVVQIQQLKSDASGHRAVASRVKW
jgi:hypothetical protein